MILVDQFMKLKVSEEFWQMFLVVIQLGAVLAVVVLDFKKLWPFHKNDPSRESNWNYISTNERIGKLQKFADKYINMNKIVLWLKIWNLVCRQSSWHFRLTNGSRKYS